MNEYACVGGKNRLSSRYTLDRTSELSSFNVEIEWLFSGYKHHNLTTTIELSIELEDKKTNLLLFERQISCFNLFGPRNP